MIAFLFAALLAQAPDSLHVTAVTLSQQSTHAMFPALNKHYGIAAVTVCDTSGAAQTIALASIAQQPGAIPHGVTVLPPQVAMQVLAVAQANTKTAKGFRWGIAIVAGAAAATQLAGVSQLVKNVLTEVAIGGSQLIPVLQNASTPVALVNYAQATLADPLQVPAGGCAPVGIVLTEVDPAAKRADFRMPVR